MATSEMNKALVALIDAVRSQPLTTPTPDTTDIAHQILQNTRINWGSMPGGNKDGGKSNWIGRLFDVLSRPNYAMAESLRRLEDPERESLGKSLSDFFSGVGAGLRGDVNPNEPGAQKTTFSDVLEQEDVTNPVVRGLGGFALDVLLDPTTYVGAGAIKAGIKGVAKGLGKEFTEKEVAKVPPTLSIEKAKPEVKVEPGQLGPVPIEEPFKRAESILDQTVDDSAAAGRLIQPKIPKYKPLSDPIDISVAQKTAKEYLRKLRSPDKIFTPRQQLLLFGNLLRKTGNNPEKAAAMLRESENYFKANGAGFKLWEGSRGSLADIIDELGGPRKLDADLLRQIRTGKISHTGLLKAVETLRARSAIEDAPKVKQLLDDVAKVYAAADSTLSPAAARNVKTAVKVPQKELLLAPTSIETANKFIQELAQHGEGYIQVGVNKQVRTLHAAVEGDTTVLKDVTESINKAKEAALNVNMKQLGKQVFGNRAVDTFAMAISTWYKNPVLRQFGLQYPTLARTSAAMRLRELRKVLKDKSQADIDKAWRAAQGYGPTSDPLAKYFRDEMERLFSSSGIKDEAESVAIRSAMTMKDINTELQRISNKWKPLKGLKFRTGMVQDPVTGQMRDYNGINWLKSWETWDIKEKPQEVLYGIQTAVEAVTKNYALQDEIVGRFASKVPTPTHTVQIKDNAYPRLKGYYFDPEIAKQLPVMFKNIKDMYASKAPLVRMFDKALGSWKRGVTIYVPSHHIRNMMGDVFLSWMAGVNNPVRYAQSAKIIRGMKERYAGVHIDDLIGKGAPERARGKGSVILRKNGRDITDEMIYTNAVNQGLLISARDIEDTLGEKLFGEWKPPVTQGRVHEFASAVSEMREHYAILAHYTDAIAKSKETDLAKIFEEAAKPVRKWHPNGTDLTATERNVFRRIIPFYSWTRKAIPLVAESIMFNPGKVNIIPKGIESLQEMLGIESPGRADLFPVDQAFPGWLREQGIGPIGLSGAGGLAGFLGGLGRTETQNVTGEPLDAYTVLGTRTNPVTDIISSFEPNPLRGVMEMTNPAIQALFELGKGETLSGRQIGSDPLRYASELLPTDPLYRIFNRPGAARGKDETPLRPFGAGPEINLEALLNTLFAAGIVGTGPYIPQRRR